MKKQRIAWTISETLNLTLIRAFSTRTTKTKCFSARSFSSSPSTTTKASTSSQFSIKNVTKSNFESALGDLKSLVRESDFVAIDLEMTGVTSAPWRESLEFDCPDIRYLKVKDSAEKFAVVQFGVCPFRWDSSKQSFIAHPHNFYIFPRQEISVDGPREFLCQTTSIEFLARYQFDFNVCIREGISYLSRQQEEEALSSINLAYEDDVSSLGIKKAKDTELVRVADILFTERLKNIIQKWHDRLLHGGNIEGNFCGSSDDSHQQLQSSFFKMRPALKLNGFTSLQLKLIELVTQKHFRDLTYVRVTGETSCVQQLIVYTDSENDRGLLMKEVRSSLHEVAEMKIKSEVGFRHVIDLLSSEQKLIVGHNCFLDIAHIYSKFFGPLPPTVEEYVSYVHKYLPNIIDTKVLLNGSNICQHMNKKRSTSLASAFTLLCPQLASGLLSYSLARKLIVNVEVQVDDQRSSSWNSGAKHEAGYDAFMTGCVFAQACSHLGFDFKTSSPSSTFFHDEKLHKYINRLYLSWNNGDTIDVSSGKCSHESSFSNSLKIRQPEILYSNIVVLWEFPSNLKAGAIRECISKVFGHDSVVSIHHLDDTAVFVQFRRTEMVYSFLKLKESLETKHDPISVLHPLSTILEGGHTCAANYEAYKIICSSTAGEILFADQAKAVGIRWKTKFLETTFNAKMQDNEVLDRKNLSCPDSYEVRQVVNSPPDSVANDKNASLESHLPGDEMNSLFC